MTPASPPDLDAFVLLDNASVAKLAGVYGGHHVQINYSGLAKSVSAWMMIHQGQLNETVGIWFWFDSDISILPFGEILTLSKVTEAISDKSLDVSLNEKKAQLLLLESDHRCD